MTINGTEVVSTAYGAGSTPASIASGLVASGSKNGLVTLKATGSNLTMTAIDDGAMWDYSYSINVASNSPVFADAPSFAASPASGSLVGGGSAPLYNWSISSYAPDGDVLAMTDMVMGGWRQQPSGKNGMPHEARLALLRSVLEPMLQRELEHRGLDKANRGFEAKLIAWLEATKS